MARFIKYTAMFTALAVCGCANTGGDYVSQHHSYYLSYLKRDTSLQNDKKAAEQELKNLDDLVIFALKNNPQLQSAFHKWRMSVEAVSAEKSLPDPQISYKYFIESVQTRVGPQNQSLTISQKLPFWTKIGYKIDIAAAKARQQAWQLEDDKLKIISAVKQQWAKLYSIQKSIELQTQTLQLMQSGLEVAQSRYEGGKITQNAILSIQLQISITEDNLLALKENFQSGKQRLNSTLGRDADAPLPQHEQLSSNYPEIEIKKFTAGVLENSPQLKAADFELAAANTAISSAKAQYIPDLTISGGWIDTESIGGASAPRDDGLDPITVGLSINIPIWANRINADIRRARANTMSVAARKYALTLELETQASEAVYNFNQAKRKIELYNNVLIPKARQSYELTQSQFVSDTANYQQLLDSIETLLEFEQNYHEALARLNIAAAMLERLSGVALKNK